jgi:hypothetical protein
MNPRGGGFAATVHIRPRRVRLRGRPSSLKGRYRDRCATGLRPALDPGASAVPHTQRHGQDQRPCPPARAALGTPGPQNPPSQVSTV